MKTLVPIVFGVACVIAACGSTERAATPVPGPQDQAVQRTATQEPTGTPGPTATSQPTVTPEPTSTPEASATPAPSSTPRPTFTALPEAATPPVATPADVSFEISIVGSDTFMDQTQAALGFLGECDPRALVIADGFIDSIQESERSGILVESGTFLASETTAFAPGYSRSAQIFWYAGTIVHDAHHRQQSEQGLTTNWDALSLSEREALESDARAVQIAALQECVDDVHPAVRYEAEYMLQYLVGMQNGDIPCDYCAVEWESRNW